MADDRPAEIGKRIEELAGLTRRWGLSQYSTVLVLAAVACNNAPSDDPDLQYAATYLLAMAQKRHEERCEKPEHR